MIDWIGFETATAAAYGVTSLALTGYLVVVRRRFERTQQAQAHRIETLEKELKALTSGALGVGRKLLGVEQRLHESEKRLQELSLSDPVRVSYSEAARLLELGADVDDLVSGCGLSRPEAELVAALHRQRSAA